MVDKVKFILCCKCGQNMLKCHCTFESSAPNWLSEINPIKLAIIRGEKGSSMRFIYGNDVYCLEFSHNKVLITYWEKGEKKEKLSDRPATTCSILRLDSTQIGLRNAEVICAETASHHRLDKFSWEAGRKAAIRKVCNTHNAFTGRIPKDMRPLIWKAYFNRNQGSDAPVPSNPTPAMAPPPIRVEIPIFKTIDAEFSVVH